MAGALRVVSYNVRYFGHPLRGLASTRKGKQLVAEAFASLEPAPDIICLQEIESVSLRSRAAHQPAHPQETQLEAFMRELEDAYARRSKPFEYEAFYFRAHTYRLRNVNLYTTGLAIILNLRTIKVASHNSSAPHVITHHHVERWKSRKQTRICAHMHLADSRGRPFTLFNTHLSLPTPFHRDFWLNREKMGWGINQVHEARSLANFIRTHARNDPFVVCGDFNSPPASPVYRYLTGEAHFHGVQETLGQIDPNQSRGFPTAGFMRWRMHLDHVFYGGPLRWLDLEGTEPFTAKSSLFAGLSDHVPLIGRFEIEAR
jgi:endonuclease/exonuclease/phosphatase family metal-dependent hydrolase